MYLLDPSIYVAAAFLPDPLQHDLGIGKLAEKAATKPWLAFGMWAVATSIMVSAPPTNGSLTSPTFGNGQKPTCLPTCRA